MKKYLFLGLLIALGLASCKGEEEDLELIVGERTTCEFEKLEHDFGTVTHGDVLKTSFKVKNTGKIPLRLIQVKPSCGCTTPSYSKEPILPGQSGVIDVEIATEVLTGGTIFKSVMVSSNTEPIKTRLSLKALIKEK